MLGDSQCRDCTIGSTCFKFTVHWNLRIPKDFRCRPSLSLKMLEHDEELAEPHDP